MADGSLIFDTKLDYKGFNRDLGKMKSFAKTGGLGVAKGLANGLLAIGSAITATTVGIGKKVFEASNSFESAFAGVQKTVDATEAEFKELRTSILEMSKSLKVANPDEIAGVMEVAGQLGISKDNLESFTKTMISMGSATNMSAEEAATALARFANVAGTSQDKMQNLGSTIVALGNNFATTESEITETASRIVGAGHMIGMSEADIMAFAGAMSSVGINAEAGGSSLSRVMNKINTEVLSGGKNLKGFADVAGLSADEFASKWKTNPADALQSFITGLNVLKDEGVDVTGVLKDLKISSIQELDTMMRLSGASDTLTNALSLARQAYQENTALSDEFNKRLATTDSIIAGLKNRVQVLAIAMGDELKVALNGSMRAISGYMSQLERAFTLDGFDGLATNVGLVLVKVTQEFSAYLPRIMDLGTKFIKGFMQSLDFRGFNIGENIGKATTTLISGLLSALPNFITGGFKLLVGFARGFVNGIPNMIASALTALKGLATSIADGLPEFIEQAPKLINDFCDNIMNAIPSVLMTGLKIIVTLGKGLIDAIPTLIANIPQIFMAIVKALSLFSLAGMGKKLLTTLGTGMKSAFSGLKTVAKGAYEAVKSVISESINGIVAIGSKLVNLFISGIRACFGYLRTVGSAIINTLKGGISSVISTVVSIGRNIVQGIANGIMQAGGAILTALAGAVDNAISWVKSKLGIHSPSRFFRDVIGKQIPAGMAIGIERSASLVKDATGKLADTSVDAMSGVSKVFGAIGKLSGSLFEKSLVERQKNVVALANDTGYKLFKAMASHMKGVDSAEKEAFLERAKKMHDLKISHIGVAYKVYQNMIVGEEKKIADKLSAIDKQIASTKNKAQKASLKSQRADLKARHDDLKAFEKSFTGTFDKMVETYEKSIEEINQKSDAMASKLASYGELVKDIQIDLGDGEKGTVTVLGDLSEQINQLKAYGDMLDKIKAKNADKDVVAKLETMGVDEALKYGQLLLSQSDKDWATYMANMAEKRRLSEQIAKDTYKSELESLDKNFTAKAVKNLQTIEKGAGDMGIKSAKALAKNFKKYASEFEEAVSSTIYSAMAKASDELGVDLFRSGSSSRVGNTMITTTNKVNIGTIKTSETAGEIRKIDEKLARYNKQKARGSMA